MGKLSKEEFLKRVELTETVKPDEWDLKMLADIDKANDTNEGTPLKEINRIRKERECSGKISVRVPKELHRSLLDEAKENGVSLNQFIVYKLAR